MADYFDSAANNSNDNGAAAAGPAAAAPAAANGDASMEDEIMVCHLCKAEPRVILTYYFSKDYDGLRPRS